MKQNKQVNKDSDDEMIVNNNQNRIYYNTFKRRFDTKRSSVEKVADKLVSTFGSLSFLLLNLMWFTTWIVLNQGLVSGIEPFDPFPFGLLNMIVSLEAIFLAIIVLISQNRESKISNLRSEIDTRIDILAEEGITKALEILVKLARKNGINLSSDKQLQRLLKPMNKSYLEKKFSDQV